MSKAIEIKEKLLSDLEAMRLQNESAAASLTKKAQITDYEQYAYTDGNGIKVWSDAIQKAIEENEILIFPASDEPYYIERSIIVPSNRYIKVEGNTTIRQKEGVTLLMLRNANTLDGTHAPIDKSNPDRNITVEGGIWEECRSERAGYGKSGKYDEERSFYGVTTCMFFDNIEGLTLKNLTFRHCGGFAIQVGDTKDAVIESIEFKECFADGVHLTGNNENILVQSIYGYVGDDLVALNAYDWKDSSVNFGPSKNIFVRNIELSPDSPLKCMRLLPGIYTFDNGDKIDCSLSNVVVSGTKGIQTFKLYLQTAAYNIDEEHEPGEVSSCEAFFFENMEIPLRYPIDFFNAYYRESHPVKGAFGAFEIGTNIGLLSIENVSLTVDKEKYPMAFLCSVGPKTARQEGAIREVFNPDISCVVEEVRLKNITINGQKRDNIDDYLYEVDFTSFGGGTGTIKKITYDN